MIKKNFSKICTLTIIGSSLIVPMAYPITISANEIQNSSVENVYNNKNLQNQLKELGEKYGFKLDDNTSNYKNSRSNNQDTLNFDSINELEEFLKESSNLQDQSVNTYNLLDENGVEHILTQQEFINILTSQNIDYTLNKDGSLNFNYEDLKIQSSMFENNDSVSNNRIRETRAASSGTSSYQFKSDSKEFNLFYKRYMDMKYEWKRVPSGGKPGSRQFVRVYNRNAYPVGLYVADWTNKNYSQTYTNGRHTVNNAVSGQWRLRVSVMGLPVNYVKPQTWHFTYTIY